MIYFAAPRCKVRRRQLTLLGRVNGRSPGFGAFVGRNYQYGDVVFGVEANYNYWSSLGDINRRNFGPAFKFLSRP